MKPQGRRYTPLSEKRFARKSRNRLIVTVILGVVLIYGLVFWIIPNLIGGLSFLSRINTPHQEAEDITENSAIAPPTLNIPYEATHSSSIKIIGFSSPNTKVEIYLDEELKSSTIVDSEGKFTSEDIPLTLGRNNINGKTVDGENGRSLPSKQITIIYDNEKPTLEVLEPQDNLISTGDKIKVSGKTDPQDTVYLEANGTRIIVPFDGNFSQTIGINEGENEIVIKASDSSGNTNQITRKVIYQKEGSGVTPTP